MNGRVRLTDGWQEKIRKCLKVDSKFVERYEEAAPLFPQVDDSSWTTGKVNFDWSLQHRDGLTIDKVLSDGYQLKGEKKGRVAAEPHQPASTVTPDAPGAGPPPKGLLRDTVANLAKRMDPEEAANG